MLPLNPAPASTYQIPNVTNAKPRMSALYLLQFFAIGALFPLWPLYYQHLGLSGRSIGLLLSVTPVAGILLPPLWGLLADRFRLHRLLLLLSTLGAAAAGLLIPDARGLLPLFIGTAVLAACQSAWTPIADSMALGIASREGGTFGHMRLWGSVGFAMATLLSGAVADRWGLPLIFWLFAVAALVSGLLVRGLPGPEGHEMPGKAVLVAHGSAGDWRGLLRQPAFLWLLLATFAVTGGTAANNFYFGLLYQAAGGSLRGMGLAFLLFAGSEVPAMLGAGRLVAAFGAAPVLFSAAVLAGARWFLYSLPLAPWQLLITFPRQGLSGGLFIVVGPMLIDRLAPRKLAATALALNGVAGFGLGAIFTTAVGGWLLDQRSVTSIYGFLTLLNLFGAAALAVVLRLVARQRVRVAEG